MKFRKDRGLKAMEKVNRALIIYAQVDFSTTLNDLLLLLTENTENEIYLPSRNIIDYTLVRLQGITKLCVRIMEAAQEASQLMGNKIALGEFWKLALIALSLNSRIWKLVKDVLNVLCELYTVMLSSRSLFHNKGICWLPQDYTFPENLAKWIDLENCTFENENVSNRKVHNFNTKTYSDLISEISSDMVREDTGEVVSRSDLFQDKVTESQEKFSRGNKKKKEIIKKTKIKKTIQNFKSVHEIKLFLKKENKLRESDESKCVFKNLDKLQWNMLVKSIKRLVKKPNISLSELKGLLLQSFQ